MKANGLLNFIAVVAALAIMVLVASPVAADDYTISPVLVAALPLSQQYHDVGYSLVSAGFSGQYYTGVPGFTSDGYAIGAVITLQCANKGFGTVCLEQGIFFSPEDPSSMDQSAFGAALSASSNYVVVGAPEYSSAMGKIFIFNCTDPTACAWVVSYSPPASTYHIGFGISLSLLELDSVYVIGQLSTTDSYGSLAYIVECDLESDSQACALVGALSVPAPGSSVALAGLDNIFAGNASSKSSTSLLATQLSLPIVLIGAPDLNTIYSFTVANFSDLSACAVPAGLNVPSCTASLLFNLPDSIVGSSGQAFYSLAFDGQSLALGIPGYSAGGDTPEAGAVLIFYDCPDLMLASCPIGGNTFQYTGNNSSFYAGASLSAVNAKGVSTILAGAPGANDGYGQLILFQCTTSGCGKAPTIIDSQNGITIGISVVIDATTSFFLTGGLATDADPSAPGGVSVVYANPIKPSSPAVTVYMLPLIEFGETDVAGIDVLKTCKIGYQTNIYTGYVVNDTNSGANVCCRARGVASDGQCTLPVCNRDPFSTTDYFFDTTSSQSFCYPKVNCFAVAQSPDLNLEAIPTFTGSLVSGFSNFSDPSVPSLPVVSSSAVFAVFVEVYGQSLNPAYTVTTEDGGNYACYSSGRTTGPDSVCEVSHRCGLSTSSLTTYLYETDGSSVCYTNCVVEQ